MSMIAPRHQPGTWTGAILIALIEGRELTLLVRPVLIFTNWRPWRPQPIRRDGELA
jgi:hypothetical protein